MINYSHEVEKMCCVKKGPHHGPAPIPEEGKWVKAYEIKDISGFSHGIGWCAPQQGTCKLSLNVKDGIVEEALGLTKVYVDERLAGYQAQISEIRQEINKLYNQDYEFVYNLYYFFHYLKVH